MTFATKLTVLRLVLVPVFAFLAISYGLSTAAGWPDETLRWAAFWVFVTAAATDGIDGWIARHFDQKSELGAFLDPIADKALVMSAVLILAFLDWGPDGWGIPWWFAALVILRDCVILVGIRVMWSARKNVHIRPHWTGKVCTFLMFVVLGCDAAGDRAFPRLSLRLRRRVHPAFHVGIHPAGDAHHAWIRRQGSGIGKRGELIHVDRENESRTPRQPRCGIPSRDAGADDGRAA